MAAAAAESGTHPSPSKKLKLVKLGADPDGCSALGCRLPAFSWVVGAGRWNVTYCSRHCAEFCRIIGAQGADWGSTQDTLDVRFYYATRRGFHSF